MSPARFALAFVPSFLALAGVAAANDLVVTSNAAAIAPWSQAMSVARFDPSLGALQSVRVELRNTIRGRVGYENLAASPASSQIALQGSVSLAGPGGFALTTITTIPVSVQTQPFDGVNDQAGSSGGVLVNHVATAANEGAASQNQIAGFVGAGQVSFQAASSNTTSLTSGSALALTSRVHLEALVQVTYTYTPFADCDHDGVPDATEPDSDGDGLPDDCDVSNAGSKQPASLLLYPEVDTGQGTLTLVTLTNTDAGAGNVRVRYVYVDGSSCLQFDREDVLTPSDTFTAVANLHTQIVGPGYMYVYVVDDQHRPIARDVLAGATLRFDALNAYAYGIDALPFRAGPGLTTTDVDGDGLRDLNGIEYEACPDVLLFPRFIGSVSSLESDLILVNLSGGGAFTATVNLFSYDDNENLYFTQAAFSCWTKRTLSSIGSVFTNDFLHNFSSNDPNEIVGFPTNEAGWFRLDGDVSSSSGATILDPAIVGVLVERAGTGYAVEVPFTFGRQTNGDLVITSPDGDTTGN